MTPACKERRVRRALERWLRRDRRARALARGVRRAQDALRDAVDEDAWRIYLSLEERANARHDAVVGVAIRLAIRGPDSPAASRR